MVDTKFSHDEAGALPPIQAPYPGPDASLNGTYEDRLACWSAQAKVDFLERVLAPDWSNRSRPTGERFDAILYFLRHPNDVGRRNVQADYKAKWESKAYWKLEGGQLYRKPDTSGHPRLFAGAPEAFDLIADCHIRLGHSGVSRTWMELRQHTYGSNEAEVGLVIATCSQCCRDRDASQSRTSTHKETVSQFEWVGTDELAVSDGEIAIRCQCRGRCSTACSCVQNNVGCSAACHRAPVKDEKCGNRKPTSFATPSMVPKARYKRPQRRRKVGDECKVKKPCRRRAKTRFRMPKNSLHILQAPPLPDLPSDDSDDGGSPGLGAALNCGRAGGGAPGWGPERLSFHEWRDRMDEPEDENSIGARMLLFVTAGIYQVSGGRLVHCPRFERPGLREVALHLMQEDDVVSSCTPTPSWLQAIYDGIDESVEGRNNRLVARGACELGSRTQFITLCEELGRVSGFGAGEEQAQRARDCFSAFADTHGSIHTMATALKEMNTSPTSPSLE